MERQDDDEEELLLLRTPRPATEWCSGDGDALDSGTLTAAAATDASLPEADRSRGCREAGTDMDLRGPILFLPPRDPVDLVEGVCASSCPLGVLAPRPLATPLSAPPRRNAAGSFFSLPLRGPLLPFGGSASFTSARRGGSIISGAYGSVGTRGAGSALSTKVSSTELRVDTVSLCMWPCSGLPGAPASLEATTLQRTLPLSRFLSAKRHGMER
mmetsp:Transcript_52218/g.124492  ORF Transcript_52218/g.124492 Transcript_52218/m.124492 type:complete len:214 (-) Transcript_52218:1083-1724(-)